MISSKLPFLAAVLALACALPSAAQKSDPPKAAGLAEAEWNFLRAAGRDKDDDVLELVLPQLEDWLVRYPENPAADEALLLKANLHYKVGDYKYALVTLLRHFHAYPRGAAMEDARKLFTEILVKKADKKIRPVLEEAGAAAEKASADAGLAALLEKLSVQAGDAYYEPVAAEFRAFFNRFPSYPRNDALRLALAAMHQKKGKYLPARLGYEKLIQLYPSSQLLARAKQSLGGVLADDIKAYDKAIEVYQDVAASFPGTDEAWSAYTRLPALAERQKKYDLAVEIHERIIKLYPDKEEAYNSYKDEARVLREELKKFPEAVAVLNRVADKYKGGRAIGALLLAAEIYRKDLKNAEGEVKTYDRIAAEYEADPQAPKSLYAAGEVYEKEKQPDKAREYYQKVLDKYNADPMAKKAYSRLNALAKM